jgi:hypothetical protein
LRVEIARAMTEMKGQVPVFIYPKNRNSVAQLNLPDTGSDTACQLTLHITLTMTALKTLRWPDTNAKCF